MIDIGNICPARMTTTKSKFWSKGKPASFRDELVMWWNGIVLHKFKSSGHSLEDDDLCGKQNVSIRIDDERGELTMMSEMSNLYHTQKVRELQSARSLTRLSQDIAPRKYESSQIWRQYWVSLRGRRTKGMRNGGAGGWRDEKPEDGRYEDMATIYPKGKECRHGRCYHRQVKWHYGIMTPWHYDTEVTIGSLGSRHLVSEYMLKSGSW